MAAFATSPQPLLAEDDRRHVRRRVPDSELITVELSPAGFGLMFNVSESGIGVYPLTELNAGQEVQVSFMLPDSPDRVECPGEVRWSADSHAGVQLKALDDSRASALKQWIATLPSPPATGKPRTQRRKFPVRDEQLHAIKAHIADERLKLDAALPFIVTRMLDLTEANGAAIALGEPDKMVCRASAGLAPEVGVQIGSASGLTGECIRARKTIYCEDTESDSRVDREACRELKLRSSLIVPVLHEQTIGGVLEVFSPRRAAFQEEHQWLVAQLAELTAQLAVSAGVFKKPEANAELITASSPATPAQASTDKKSQTTGLTESATIGGTADEIPANRHPRQFGVPSWQTLDHGWKIGVAVLAAIAIILLIWLVWRNAVSTTKVNNVTTAAIQPIPNTTAPVSSSAESSTVVEVSPRRTSSSRPKRVRGRESVSQPPEVDPIILPRSDAKPIEEVQEESAPEVKLASSANLKGLVLPASTQMPDFKVQSLSGGKLIHRVEPNYPKLALQQRIQGDVVVRAHIVKDGSIAGVHLLKGDPMLGSAAKAAIRQWRYEPFQRDGEPEETDTTITLQFRIH